MSFSNSPTICPCSASVMFRRSRSATSSTSCSTPGFICSRVLPTAADAFIDANTPLRISLNRSERTSASLPSGRRAGGPERARPASAATVVSAAAASATTVCVDGRL